jgi:hypothetical protein
MIDAFPYAATPHERRHGPAGYSSYKPYKDWLRDDFAFRCVYCLFREKWYPNGAGSFGVDHLVPQTQAPELALTYDNFLYSCNRCNSLKTDLEGIIDPCTEPVAKHVNVRPDGTVKALTVLGQDLLDALDLNAPDTVEWRKDFLLYAEKLNEGVIKPPDIADVIRSYFAFPEHLPDLRDYRPPSNSRPDGVQKTYFVLRENGTLPPTY